MFSNFLAPFKPEIEQEFKEFAKRYRDYKLMVQDPKGLQQEIKDCVRGTESWGCMNNPQKCNFLAKTNKAGLWISFSNNGSQQDDYYVL